MTDNTLSAFVSITITALLGYFLFATSSCQRHTEEVSANTKSEERKDMLEHGYELRPIPGKVEPIWVKAEHK